LRVVDDLPFKHAHVEAILDGTFKPQFWAISSETC